MQLYKDDPNTKADDIHFIVQALGPPIITVTTLLLTGVIIVSDNVSDSLKNTLGVALPTTALAGYFGVSRSDDRTSNKKVNSRISVNEPLSPPQENSDIGY